MKLPSVYPHDYVTLLLFSGIHDLYEWAVSIVTTVGTIGSILALLYTLNPIVFMKLSYEVLFFFVSYVSTAASIGVLSFILLGRFLAGMIASHEDVPAICAVSCKLVILTCQDMASGEIFEQFENADALSKLLSAMDKQMKILKSSKRIDYAKQLSPLSRVLVMLVSSYEKELHRGAIREGACAILREYNDVPCGQSEDVAQVVGNAAFVLNLLVVRRGNLAFSTETNSYNGTPSPAVNIKGLRDLLKELFEDHDLCTSLKSFLGQSKSDCSLHTAGQVCSLLHCLCHADRLCFDAAANQNQSHSSRVAHKIFSASSSDPSPELSDLLRLLEREIQALSVSDTDLSKKKDSACERHPHPLYHYQYHGLCSMVGTLRMVLPLLIPTTTAQSNANIALDMNDDDACLAGSLTVLGEWMENMHADESLGGSKKAETKRLLRVLLDNFAAMLEGSHDRHWQKSIAAVGRNSSLLHSAAKEEKVRALQKQIDDLQAEITVLRKPNISRELHILKGHSNDVNSVSFIRHKESQLASGSKDKTIKIWSLSTGACDRTLEGHSGPVRSVCFSPNRSQLASGSGDTTIKLWSVSTGECDRTLEGHSGPVWSVCFSPDGTHLASGSHDKTIKIWSLLCIGTCSRTFEGHSGPVWSVCFSPDGSQLASGSQDKTIKIWSLLSTGKCDRILEGHSNYVFSVCFSPNGSQLASGSLDKTIKIWSMATGKCDLNLEGHSGTVRSVCFSSDGSQLASGSQDKTIKLWSLSTGKCDRTLKGHSGPVCSVCFNLPDGSQLFSGSDDMTIKLWGP